MYFIHDGRESTPETPSKSGVEEAQDIFKNQFGLVQLEAKSEKSDKAGDTEINLRGGVSDKHVEQTTQKLNTLFQKEFKEYHDQIKSALEFAYQECAKTVDANYGQHGRSGGGDAKYTLDEKKKKIGTARFTVNFDGVTKKYLLTVEKV